MKHRISLPIYFLWLLGMALSTSLAASKDVLVIAADTLIDSLIRVPEGTTLLIKPGVTVAFSGYGRVDVRGTILAEGTPTRMILFTAEGRPKGSSAKPAWKGLEIYGKASVGRFKHCRFEGAFRNLVWAADPIFDSCAFAGNHYAFYCAKQAKPIVRNCQFYHNRYGIAVDYAAALLLDNVVTANAIGVYLQLTSQSIISRNIIKDNEVNIRSEEIFGENKGSASLHALWGAVGQLY